MITGNQALTTLPNIGKTLAEKLSLVGIETREMLEQMGSEQAFIRLIALDKESCFNSLCALEGAVLGIRWHALSDERKAELKVFFNQVIR